jgi:Pyridine nucleotide-disulphide oxidoreductase
MLVIGGGDTGLQVASIFNAFGSQVQILEAAPRILLHADDDVAASVAAAFRMPVQENFGAIESFEKTATGVRMNFSKDGHRGSAEAALAVVAVGWAADTASLGLATGVELNQRGCPDSAAYYLDRALSGYPQLSIDDPGALNERAFGEAAVVVKRYVSPRACNLVAEQRPDSHVWSRPQRFDKAHPVRCLMRWSSENHPGPQAWKPGLQAGDPYPDQQTAGHQIRRSNQAPCNV